MVLLARFLQAFTSSFTFVSEYDRVPHEVEAAGQHAQARVTFNGTTLALDHLGQLLSYVGQREHQGQFDADIDRPRQCEVAAGVCGCDGDDFSVVLAEVILQLYRRRNIYWWERVRRRRG